MRLMLLGCWLQLWLALPPPALAEEWGGLKAAFPKARNANAVDYQAWTNANIRSMADSIRPTVEGWRAHGQGQLDEADLRQALMWASYPKRISSTHLVVYANKPHENLDLLTETSPFPVTILTRDGDWEGTSDKMLAYGRYLSMVDDDCLVIFVDAFDVFGNGISGHELLRRYFAFDRPIVIATEENIFPRVVAGPAEQALELYGKMRLGNASAPSRYVNAGGIMGVAWALKRMFDDMYENMIARGDPALVQRHADMTGHWWLQAYDQYELWRFVIRHIVAVHDTQAELLIGLDIEQEIFGSTVLVKDNWPTFLGDDIKGEVNGVHSVDDVPLVFGAPQSLWAIRRCSARFVGRRQAPVFWHGNGHWKPAWCALRDRLAASGCF